MTWTVVKVGGSLYDWPELGDRLRHWLARLDAEHVLLVPGGGAMADTIRSLDNVHHLGEEMSHWLAIRSLSLNACFLQSLLSGCEMVRSLDELATARSRLNLLDAFPFFDADEKQSDHLPHDWSVTSDSLAVRVAMLVNASELVLLKSSDWRGDDWVQATTAGVVDRYFTQAMTQISTTLTTRIVNLRAWVPDERPE